MSVRLHASCIRLDYPESRRPAEWVRKPRVRAWILDEIRSCDDIWGICEGAYVVNLENEDMGLFTCKPHSWSVRGTGLCYLYLIFTLFMVLLYVDAAKGSALWESVWPDMLTSSVHMCMYICVCVRASLEYTLSLATDWICKQEQGQTHPWDWDGKNPGDPDCTCLGFSSQEGGIFCPWSPLDPADPIPSLTEGFGFYNHGTGFEHWGLLGRDGIHLIKWSKNIFANRLSNLDRRPLN